MDAQGVVEAAEKLTNPGRCDGVELMAAAIFTNRMKYEPFQRLTQTVLAITRLSSTVVDSEVVRVTSNGFKAT